MEPSRILGCSSKTCNEAVRGEMDLDTLQSSKDRAKLKWLLLYLKIGTQSSCLITSGILKPRRGRKRKVWSRMVDDLFKSLDIHKSEWLEDSMHGDSSSAYMCI